MKLYNQTGNEEYLKLAKTTYSWTKKYLCDPEDYVYWDYVGLDGNVDKAKYTYNSGQMIHAGVLLYQATGENDYLQDARTTAASTYRHFVKTRKGIDGTEALFYPSTLWFNVVLLRGFVALYEEDANPEYIRTMAENASYAWENTRDENGFLGEDWTGTKEMRYKWLLDNACMIELFAEISSLNL